MAAIMEQVTLTVPIDGEDCEISVAVPALLDGGTSPLRAAEVLVARLINQHGLPCYLQEDLERTLLMHLTNIRQVLLDFDNIIICENFIRLLISWVEAP
jgi:hypothetical protein